MVLVLHIMSLGGAMGACAKGSLHYYVSMMLYVASYCAVNCFALTSGYLLYDRKFKSGRVISLWLQVVFYGLMAVAVCAVALPGSIGLLDIVQAVFPVTSGVNWYFSAYVGLYLFMPFMNKLISSLSHLQMKALAIMITVLFCGVNLFSDTFNLQNGYGIVWLMALYFVGAYMRKYDVGRRIKKSWLFFAAIILIAVLGLSQPIISKVINGMLGLPLSATIFIVYTSPIVLGIALVLLLFFSKCYFGGVAGKVFATVAPLSFAAYLIHTQPLVNQYLFADQFAFMAQYSLPVYLVMILAAVVAIFLVSIFIEKLRLLLFRWVGIESAIKRFSNYMDGKITIFFP